MSERFWASGHWQVKEGKVASRHVVCELVVDERGVVM
jgi:hypothetical protein